MVDPDRAGRVEHRPGHVEAAGQQDQLVGAVEGGLQIGTGGGRRRRSRQRSPGVGRQRAPTRSPSASLPPMRTVVITDLPCQHERARSTRSRKRPVQGDGSAWRHVPARVPAGACEQLGDRPPARRLRRHRRRVRGERRPARPHPARAARPVAELQVANTTGLPVSSSGSGITIVPVNRGEWVQRSTPAYRELLEVLAGSLGQTMPLGGMADDGGDDDDDPSDPFAQMLAPLMQSLRPMMMGVTAGSMLGHLARRSFGQYDLPVPRPPSDELLVVVPNIDEFGDEWSLTKDDLRLWVCIHEVAHHAVLNVPHVRERLSRLLREYASSFQPDPSALESKLGRLDLGDPSSLDELQHVFGDPEVLLGAIQSPAQREILPQPRSARVHDRGLRRPRDGHDRPGPCRQLRDAHRGGAPPSRDDRSLRPLRRAPPRPRPRPVALRARRQLHRRHRRASRARPASSACGAPSASCRPRPRSTPPASGSPASTSPPRPTDGSGRCRGPSAGTPRCPPSREPPTGCDRCCEARQGDRSVEQAQVWHAPALAGRVGEGGEA